MKNNEKTAMVTGVTAFTRQGSLVQSQYRPPVTTADDAGLCNFEGAHNARLVSISRAQHLPQGGRDV